MIADPVREFSFNDDLLNRIKRNLSGFSRVELAKNNLAKAAVSIIVAKNAENSGASVLLTLRPKHMNRHSGQFALPGGRLDDGETVVNAALRETREELGLKLDQSNILGKLDDYPTRSGFCVSPLVMWSESEEDLKPDPNEVKRVYHIPFEELNSPQIPSLSETANGNNPVLSAHLPSAGGYVYAPTAAILYQFREVAIRGLDTRVAHFGQPEFAWK